MSTDLSVGVIYHIKLIITYVYFSFPVGSMSSGAPLDHLFVITSSDKGLVVRACG